MAWGFDGGVAGIGGLVEGRGTVRCSSVGSACRSSVVEAEILEVVDLALFLQSVSLLGVATCVGDAETFARQTPIPRQPNHLQSKQPSLAPGVVRKLFQRLQETLVCRGGPCIATIPPGDHGTARTTVQWDLIRVRPTIRNQDFQ